MPFVADQYCKMVFRMAFFLLAFVVFVGGVNSAAIGEEGNYGDSEWPAGISPLDSLSYWRNDGSEKASDADNKRTCCVPRIWTGRLFTEYRVERSSGWVTYRFQQVVYFDQVNKRLAADSIVGDKTVESYILLFNKTGATKYTFSKTTKQCITQFFQGAQIRQECIPPNATLLRSFSLGAGGGALKTQSWGYSYRDRRVDSAVNILVTPGNCIPVIAAYASASRATRMNVGTLFTDMKTNIADQSVFTPPSFCRKREGEERVEREGEGEQEDEKLYFDHHDFHINAIIEGFVAVP